jgi:GNAT superfamily N-acetyltransferase
MIEWNRIILFGRDAGTLKLTQLQPGQRFLELFPADVERISAADKAHGRRGDHKRILRRFEHGLRYFAVEEDRGLIAWFWVAHGVPRYFDEMAWRLPLDKRHVWGRDAYVAPDRRGHRILAAIMDHASAAEDTPMQFLSDVSSINVPSRRAHKALGFSELGTVTSLALGSRLLIRSRPPEFLPAPTGIRPQERVLWMTKEEREWHRAQIA